MVDRYTKIMLTIIAVALVILAAEQMTSRVNAQIDSCGTQQNPCAIALGVVHHTGLCEYCGAERYNACLVRDVSDVQ